MLIDNALRLMSRLSDAQEFILRNDKHRANTLINDVKMGIMFEVYLSEWRSVDGVPQHPDGYNFQEWMLANNIFISNPEV